MGHYDSCYEWDEDQARMRRAGFKPDPWGIYHAEWPKGPPQEYIEKKRYEYEHQWEGIGKILMDHKKKAKIKK